MAENRKSECFCSCSDSYLTTSPDKIISVLMVNDHRRGIPLDSFVLILLSD